MRHILIIFMLLAFTVHPASAQTYETEHGGVSLKIVADGLDHPWGLAFLPDGTIIVSERDTGTLRLVTPDGAVMPPLKGTPEAYTSGQGGMLDIATDPDFKSNNLIYFSYAEPGEGGAGTAVARAKLDQSRNELNDATVIFQQVPKTSGGRHFGSRLVFSPGGQLYILLVNGASGTELRIFQSTVDKSFGSILTVQSQRTIHSLGVPGTALKRGLLDIEILKVPRCIHKQTNYGSTNTVPEVATK